jgi:hypothetical protein
MDTYKLASAVREQATLVNAWSDCGETVTETQANDVSELLRTLARIIEGKDIETAFGSPGDWGYETRIGEALAAFKKEGGA